jgi:hypothetical protein
VEHLKRGGPPNRCHSIPWPGIATPPSAANTAERKRSAKDESKAHKAFVAKEVEAWGVMSSLGVNTPNRLEAANQDGVRKQVVANQTQGVAA